ncbi:MAG TPA: AAA family ATPase, partial [Woeseiaceae bacterium]|nr:AAA family ATPase [Woeseiaceae bacterium]
QFQLGLRMLKEAGVTPCGALYAARRGPRIDAPPAVAPDPDPLPSRPAAVGTAALIGREEEFAGVTAACDEALCRGNAAVLLLHGAPGMGKSRLLASVLEHLQANDSFVLRSAAFESDTIRPFALWIDALREFDSELCDRLFGATDTADRDRLFASLSAFLSREAAERPVVLLFDDIHWSDESSAAALHYVLRMNRERPVLAVVAARDGELRDNAQVELALRGLRRDGLLREVRLAAMGREQLARLIAAQQPAADSERLSRESGGNPLLALELARAECEGGSGGSLRDLVHERMARFTVVGAEVLQWAAVLRPHIDLKMLVRVTELDARAVGEVLGLAESHSMLVPGERGLRFSHELIAEAVYADISPLRRQVMHRRVAELLEQDTALDLARAADLAHHATQSRDAGIAARAMVSAGRLCLRFFANEDARSLARKGLQFCDKLAGAERSCAEIELHDVLLCAAPVADWEAAAETYAALAEKALDHGALAHARLGYHLASYVRWAQGRWSAAREQTLQAERVMRGTDSEANIVGMAETAKCLIMLESDLTQADALLMEADALARRRQFVHHAIAAGLGMLRYHENRLDEAQELLQQARTLCKSAGDRIDEFLVSEYLVMIDLQRGRVVDARTRCAQLVELGERIREGSEAPFARALLGICSYALDDDTAMLEGALGELRVVDAKYRLAYALTRAALLDCERGRLQDAASRAAEALDYARILERPTEMLLAHAVLACGAGRGACGGDAAAHLAEIKRLEPLAARWTGDIEARLAAHGEHGA